MDGNAEGQKLMLAGFSLSGRFLWTAFKSRKLSCDFDSHICFEEPYQKRIAVNRMFFLTFLDLWFKKENTKNEESQLGNLQLRFGKALLKLTRNSKSE